MRERAAAVSQVEQPAFCLGQLNFELQQLNSELGLCQLSDDQAQPHTELNTC